MSDLQLDDTVKAEGRLSFISNNTGYAEVTLSNGEIVAVDDIVGLTFVSRPEPTYTVELTYEQLDRLCVEHVTGHLSGSVYDALCVAWDRARDERP